MPLIQNVGSEKVVNNPSSTQPRLVSIFDDRARDLMHVPSGANLALKKRYNGTNRVPNCFDNRVLEFGKTYVLTRKFLMSPSAPNVDVDRSFAFLNP